YLAGGLHEEVLGQLYRVPALQVIGRSSVMSYDGPNPPPISQVARELQVGSVVEGSVQVLEGRVRVNIRLIDAATGAPLWTQQYDRTLDDAFAIQSEVAQQIVATVGAALTNAEAGALTAVPTEKAEAYLLYLQGRDHQRRPGMLRESFEAAERLYEQALALDPDFAQAHASLSAVHGFMYWLRYDMTPARLARQRNAAEIAQRLAPDLAEAHISMAHVYAVGQVKSRQGLEHLRIAARLSPNDPAVWRWIAQTHRRLGEWDEFVEPFQRAVALDPRNADLLWDQGGGTYGRMGRFAEAIQWFDRALRIAPDLEPPAINKGWYYLAWQGQLDTLRAVIDELSQRPGLGGETDVLLRARLLHFERRADSLLRVLERAPGPVLQSVTAYTPLSLWKAWAYELRSDSIAARAAYEDALVTIDSAIRVYRDDWPLHQARGMALAGLGRREQALDEVRWLENCPIYREDMYLSPRVAVGAAKILARLGETDAALDRVERLVAQRPPGLAMHLLRLDPHWDPIREHPRYHALLRTHAS
ncbi:MAG TPA: tetratricopeptide repeat protein, partial [Gemmatimonadaceae bacterium]|nr:tetratricopeptide repeat protein [Gemmatimonadaceae bacterium]